MSDLSVASVGGSDLWWRVRDIPRRFGMWLVRLMLRQIVRMQDGNSGLMAYGRIELRKQLAEPKDSPDRWMADDLMQMLAVFSAHGHSGFSASYAVSMFTDLARYKPLGPLTGEADEWVDHGDGLFQNKRCGRVFKQPDRFDGQAYDLDGRVFREPNGVCYTNHESMIPVTFPYTPKTEYVDVPARD
jgi:hypothetical protein